MAFDLADYVPVSDRIEKWYFDHPEGRIVADPPVLVDVAGRLFVASTVRVYRTADDVQPCQGSAWEPYPGPTPYTKDSEAMNAETSAVGRALALAGVEVKRGMASQEDVRNRQPVPPPPSITEAQAEAMIERFKLLPDDMRHRAAESVKQAGIRIEQIPESRWAEALAFLELCEMEAADDAPFNEEETP